jgi:hypothetical protein
MLKLRNSDNKLNDIIDQLNDNNFFNAFLNLT